MNRIKRSLILAASAALPLAACTSAGYGQQDIASASTAAVQAPKPKAKNVILFIGDGMGISTITAMRIYAGQKLGQTGEEFVLPFENFDNVALVKTYNVDAQVPDSAGTATAMHSGAKTNIGYLGVGPQARRHNCTDTKAYALPLIGEQAVERGLALGIVSTARITHATPASVYARASDRDWESDAGIPEDQRGLGCDDIATQLVKSDFTVALGGGRAAFFGEAGEGWRTVADANLPADWVARTGGTYVENASELAAAPAGAPVFGLFDASHMDYMANPERDESQPTLTDMTHQALSRLSSDPDGFYLMVESGRIDHAHHGGRAGAALEEGVEFARAIQYAIDNTNPEETLILVTADHSHVFNIAGYPRRGNDILGLVVPPEGGSSELAEATTAADGKPYTTLGYLNGPGSIANLVERPVPETGVHAQQQAAIPTSSETHAGEDVALYGHGPGANRVRGVIEQNVVYDIIVKALGWDE